MSQESVFSLSTLSLNSLGSQGEDWDRSLILPEEEPSDESHQSIATTTPRNSVIFSMSDDATPGRTTAEANGVRSLVGRGKRSLSELLRLHAEKGTDCNFSADEASTVAEVLGQWINASSSPYEGEDDFFARSQDDLSIPSSSKRSGLEGRPRGQSESANSRPPSSTGFAKA